MDKKFKKTTKKVVNELKDVKKEDMIYVDPVKHKEKKSLYIGYSERIILFSLLFTVLTVLSFYFMNKSINIQEAEKINYQETSNIDYKVKVKENDFYETEYLSKNMNYIASLIDSVNVKYNYKFTTSKELNSTFNYRIIGTLEILNAENNGLVYTKDYELLENKTVDIKSEKEYLLNEELNIDYGKYNELAKDFKSKYGINSISNLKVYLIVDRKIDNKNIKNNEMDGTSKMLLTIPLSEKMLSIKLDYKDIDKKDTVISNAEFGFKDIWYLGLGIVLLIIGLLFLIKVCKLLNGVTVKNTSYDKYVKKILRDYDRLIVNAESMPDLSEYEVTHVKTFGELLDAKDNLLKPICFYEVNVHNKCHFFVKSEKDIYLLTIKDVDLD